VIPVKALEKVRIAGEVLREAGIEHPLRDAELIVAHCLRVSRTNLFRDDPEIGANDLAEIEKSVGRRAGREPLQYILGYTEFLGLIVRVGPGVLIPRPETELLAEEAIRTVRAFKTGHAKLKILDLCTGSGCIALSLAREFHDAEVYGTDTSEAAIRYSEENARRNNLRNALFLHGSLFEPVRRITPSRMSEILYDLVISNPPYIRTGDMKNLQPEIGDWEPKDALDGGEDGLDYYRTIIPQAKEYLKREGALMFEIGIDQAERVKEIAKDSGYQHTAVRKDYAGIDRILTIWQ
jgi:release factor glutamine methyltransferase